MRWGTSTEGPESLQWRNYAWYYDPETVAHEAATVCSLTDDRTEASVVVEGNMLHIIN